MTPEPPPPPPLAYENPAHVPQGVNVPGLVGFILTMIALVGICISPVLLIGVAGFIVSLFGIRKKPNGLAIAGVVVGAIESLIALFMLAIIGLFVTAGVAGANRATKVGTSFSNAVQISHAIDQYKSQNGTLPATLNDLQDPTLPLNDGWGQPIRYVVAGNDYQLFGAGHDGLANTTDDITLRRTGGATTWPTLPARPAVMRPATQPTP